MNSPSIVPAMTEVHARRAELFRETPLEAAERIALGTAWSLKPKRIVLLPGLARIWLRDTFRAGNELPDPKSALKGPNAIAGIARDLSVPTLLEAYKRTLYPWGHFGPFKWLSSEQRCVLFFNELRIGKNVRRLMRRNEYRVTFDTDFEGVMKACAARRADRWHLTWLRPKIMHAMADLYDAGHAHSFEVWNKDGQLVGGGYGVAVNGVFHTESQFSRESNTSKMGFALLNWHLAKWGFLLNDGKDMTPTIAEMNFRMIPRSELQANLDKGTMDMCRPGRWECETDLKSIAEWMPGGVKAGATS
jgi:leucyl/phenylalanyl-tRNA--protein transferase